MNKKLQFKSLLLLTAMLIGASSAWAGDIVYKSLTFPDDNSTNNGLTNKQYESTWTAKIGNDSWSISNFNNNNWNNNWEFIKCGRKNKASVATLSTASAIDKAITKVGVTIDAITTTNVNSIKLYKSSDGEEWTEVGSFDKETGEKIVSLSSPTANLYYKIEFDCTSGGANGLIQVSKVNYYIEATEMSVAAPTFTPTEGTYTSTQNVTLSCTTNGATIYYTTDGSTPTSSSNKYESAISIEETTTIKAIAIKGGDASVITSATFFIEKTIAHIRALGTGDVYTKGTVTSVNGKTAYIQDNTAAIAVYNSAANLTVAVGDEIKVSGTLGTYNGLLQIQTPTITVESSGNTVAPVVKTIEEINSDYTTGSNALQGMLVKIVEATVTAKTGTTTTNATIKQGDNTIDVRGIAQDVEYAVNDKLTLVGNVGCFNTAQIANPTNVEVVKNEKPAISAEDVTIEFDATAGEIEYTVDNPTSATLTATLTPGISWISNINVTADKVTFTAEANEGAERTATITLSYTNAEDKVVTITQKKYGIASVPFAFYGGVNDITTTYGLTQEGLGSDYGSNAPKLKFDTGDDKSKDNLILRINDAAKVLSFDIKGNSFSGGTFDVLTSADGETYTQLASYTELTSTVLHESFILNNDVRYIKWIYTNKQNGNVGLGNIKVFSNESVAIPVSKYTTFVSTANIDFSGTGVTAYTAEVNGNAAKLSAISGNIVPANTGVILYAETAGNYVGTITEGDPTSAPVSVDGNDLVGVTTETAVPWTANSKYNYILQGGVFKKATGAKLHAGKAYLSIEKPAASRELNIVFEGEATAIKAIETANDKSVYDLQGRKVAAPTKGLYIINGKKMIVK